MHLGRRETAVLLASVMMRGAGLDWFEQGDVWAKVAALRPATAPQAPERAAELAPVMRKLMTADAPSLCCPGGPLRAHEEWVTAFERAGGMLAGLADRGALTRGLRAVIAHHVIFHANRAGLLRDDQSALSHIAREAVMGTSDHTESPTEATTGVDSRFACRVRPRRRRRVIPTIRCLRISRSTFLEFTTRPARRRAAWIRGAA